MKKISILKSICLASMVIAPLANANARHLSPEEALQRANSNSGAKRIPGIKKMTLAYSESFEDKSYAYVFNNSDNGFIVVSADDRMAPMLGYSEKGAFDLEKASPSLRWWLSQYAEEAAAKLSVVEDTDSQVAYQTRSEFEREEIHHLLQTEWGQESPFNLQCPKINDQQCVTGCVATAMAQIIKYHGYPTSGHGEHSYGDFSFDYENASFRYDIMDNTYSTQTSQESKNAVALLMYACGVAVNMNYSLEQSGASDYFIAYALRNYFKFDNGVRFLQRSLFTASQWEDLVYDELSESRPVLYGGQAPNGGHQFVCDGYDGNGYFHINWGWEGYGDGFFRLNALDPHYEGVGGFEGGYNSDQTIVCGIQPPVANSNIWYPIYSTGSIYVSAINNSSVNLAFSSGGIWNYSQQPVDVEILIEAEAEDGSKFISKPYPFMIQGDTEPRTAYPFGGAAGSRVYGWGGLAPLYLPENLPAGDYKCYLVIKTPEGDIQRILFPITSVAYFNLNVSPDGNVTYTPGVAVAKAEIRVSGFEPTSEVIQNEKTSFLLTIENFGEVSFSGNIYYQIFKDGERVDDVDYLMAFRSIEPGASPTYIYEHTFELEPATYEFIFFDQSGDPISEPFQITIGASGVEEIFTSSSVDVYSSEGVLIMKNADKSDLSHLSKGIYILKDGRNTVKIIR